MSEERGLSIEDLEQELKILNEFKEYGRARVLRGMIQHEIQKQERLNGQSRED